MNCQRRRMRATARHARALHAHGAQVRAPALARAPEARRCGRKCMERIAGVYTLVDGSDAQRAVEDPPPLDEDAEGALDAHPVG